MHIYSYFIVKVKNMCVCMYMFFKFNEIKCFIRIRCIENCMGLARLMRYECENKNMCKTEG